MHRGDGTNESDTKRELQSNIGAGLCRARKKLGISQSQAAERIGIATEFYGRIERGHACPSVPVFKRMVVELQVDAAKLLQAKILVSTGSPAHFQAIARIVDHLEDASELKVRFVRMLVRELEECLAEEAAND